MSSSKEMRKDELLVDQATGDLDALHEAELRALLDGNVDLEHNPFVETAALVQLGMASLDQTRGANSAGRMPNHLRARLEAAAPTRASVTQLREPRTSVTPLRDAQPGTENKRGLSMRDMGWALAAAFAVALVVVNVQPDSANPAEQRNALIASASDTQIIEWGKSNEPGYANVSGDVSWSDARQEGYMRLAGLPANDPANAQYQLWIVDPERAAQPVDGGVFDMPAGKADVVIPITAKLSVNKPVAFAITLEQPGGVVVSEGPLLVVAAATES